MMPRIRPTVVLITLGQVSIAMTLALHGHTTEAVAVAGFMAATAKDILGGD